MRTAIIHIGTTKTGTTSIQRCLDVSRPALAEQGACYPRTPGKHAHAKLHVMLVRQRLDQEEDGEERPETPGMDAFPDRFMEEMRELPDGIERVIFSEERFSFLRPAEIGALKAFLDPYFSSFKIVVYLRRQDSYLASRYSEQLRHGWLSGPDNAEGNSDRLANYDYEALVNRWADVFGADAMALRLYQRGTGAPFDAVDDFLGVCGLSLEVPPDDPGRSRNPSMSVAGQHLMLRMADAVKQATGATSLRGGVWFELAACVSYGAPGQGWLPTRGEAAAFMEQFAAGNEAIRQRFFPDRPTLFADESERFPVKAPPEDEAAIREAGYLAFMQGAVRAFSAGEGSGLGKPARKRERRLKLRGRRRRKHKGAE